MSVVSLRWPARSSSRRFGYDDSLDVFGVHALGGAWGALASGIFAVTLGSGIESNAQQIMVQLKGIGFVVVFAPVATVVILSALKLVFGSLRVADEEEAEGLDLAEHSESAYSTERRLLDLAPRRWPFRFTWRSARPKESSRRPSPSRVKTVPLRSDDRFEGALRVRGDRTSIVAALRESDGAS